MSLLADFFIKNSSIIIQAVFIIVGWVIVHRLSSKRDVQKTRRDIISSSIDKMCELVNLIVDDANAYHAHVRDEKKENKIKRQLNDLSIRAASLADLISENSCDPIWQQIRKFRQAITGNHFEDEHVSELPSSNHQFELIAEYEISLKRTLFELKHAQFKLD